MSKHNKDNEQSNEHDVLGSTTNPQAQDLPTTNGADNSVDPPTTEAGSATHLNAYRQEVEELRAQVINTVNDGFDKAIAAVDVAQSRLTQ
jgi:hypothetical protein